MEEIHGNIVKRALEAYMLYGIKSITMNDMATKLGISKKTLYKYVTDKDDLVKQALHLQASEEQKDIESICACGYKAIEESFTISQYISQILKNISPSVHYDLEKYHKSTFEKAFADRQVQIFDCLKHNITKGIKEGVYRDDFNIEIVIKLYLSKIHSLFDGNLFPPDRFTFVEVNETFFEYHIHGIATPKGIKHLDKVLKNKKR